MIEKPKCMTVMLDAGITEALLQLQNTVVQKVNKAGVYGMAAKPSLGFLARRLLRDRLGMPTDGVDKPSAD